MLKIFPIDQVRSGMFVNQVTKQTATLKIKTRGLIKSQSQVQRLIDKGIREVEVDLSRSVLEQPLEIEDDADALAEGPASKVTHQKPSDGERLGTANTLYDKAKNVQSRFIKKVKNSRPSSVKELEELSADIIDSVFEDPNAICCLTLIKERDKYLLEHSLNCAILMALFARHLGFDKELIDNLGLAGLMMDLGMNTIPPDILNKKSKLDNQEWQIIHGHVDVATEILDAAEIDNQVIREVVTHHHERLDGSGYPSGLSGDALSVYARMAAIVDSYDAMTSTRPWRKAYSPTQALKQLLGFSQGQLDQSLVHQFIRCIGVHPVGSLVKLKSGKLAIVTRANKEDPLSPMVMTFYSVRSGHYNEIKQLDLSKAQDEIESSVRPEEFKINLTKFFKEVFLQQVK
ncbi:HD-GYP domain-containing protein [Lacimicrobium alkaliphilum]|uniref:Phosphodiesterase n=1 Tax=Lacimicrobium alkaliphilum TaxID=1526571 RepID=A0ABQ1R4L6_9ALTE|nr:HD-GYP domain-containing protein [Lacimicrobium alkaliphilum]GGD57961.1 phosphodiesterase [Lacimicrobium alkaliphilum]